MLCSQYHSYYWWQLNCSLYQRGTVVGIRCYCRNPSGIEWEHYKMQQLFPRLADPNTLTPSSDGAWNCPSCSYLDSIGSTVFLLSAGLKQSRQDKARTTGQLNPAPPSETEQLWVSGRLTAGSPSITEINRADKHQRALKSARQGDLKKAWTRPWATLIFWNLLYSNAHLELIHYILSFYLFICLSIHPP